ncbi:hypothetical protein NXV47_21575 [Bacteroides uniformis]|nr:hypothetical protein [Bacteroides uniformis]
MAVKRATSNKRGRKTSGVDKQGALGILPSAKYKSTR